MSTYGVCSRLRIVPGEARSPKASVCSSTTLSVPLGLRFGRPLGPVVATYASPTSATILWASGGIGCPPDHLCDSDGRGWLSIRWRLSASRACNRAHRRDRVATRRSPPGRRRTTARSAGRAELPCRTGPQSRDRLVRVCPARRRRPSPPSTVRRQHTVVPDEVDARPRPALEAQVSQQRREMRRQGRRVSHHLPHPTTAL